MTDDDYNDLNSSAYKNALQGMVNMGAQHGQFQDLSASGNANMAGYPGATPTTPTLGVADAHPFNSPSLQVNPLPDQSAFQASPKTPPPLAQTATPQQPPAQDSSAGNPFFYAGPDQNKNKQTNMPNFGSLSSLFS